MNYIFLLLSALVLVSCTSHNQDLYALKKYQESDPKSDLKRDIANRDIHFLAVLGFAREIPGIGMIEKENCFKDISSKLIDKTGDSFDEDIFKVMKLKSGARKYTTKYNQLLKKHLIKQGDVFCAPEARWNLAFEELNGFIWGSPVRHGSGLGMNMDSPPSFTISLVDISLAEETTNKACEIFKKNGIKNQVLFKLDEHKRQNNKWVRTEIATFYCIDGRKTKLDYVTASMTDS